MNEQLSKLLNQKSFHIIILVAIVFILLVMLGFFLLRYSVEGETNMPFILSKISIISSAEGIDNPEQIEGNKWNFTINQNNDIYLYIEKNANYEKVEAIENVTIKNIVMTKKNEKGTLKTYKPNAENPNVIFKNAEESAVETITYNVEENADVKNLKITNQGGIIAFRFANEGIAQYIANDEEINHNDLLKKAQITQDQLQSNIQFDLIIQLKSGKTFQTTITLDLPMEGVIETGTKSQEFTDTEKYIFKRIKQ